MSADAELFPAPEGLEGRIALLKQISDLAVSSHTPDEIYQRLVAITAELLQVDICSLVLESEKDGLFRIRAARGLAPRVIASSVIRVGEGITGYVLQKGEPLLIRDIESHPLFHRRSSTRYRTVSLLCLPLRANGRVVGALNVNNKRNREPFSDLDAFFLGIIANHVGGVIEKVHMEGERKRHRHLDEQLDLASGVQRHLFPQTLPQEDDVAFFAECLAAKKLGGDLYDVITVSRNEFFFVIGDVSGKGMPAALYMANIAGKLRLLARAMREPGLILETINNALVEETVQGHFVTLFVGFYRRRGRKLLCSVAGHLPPILRRARPRSTELLTLQGAPPLGIIANLKYPTFEMKLQRGDGLLFYTDGITEAADGSGDRYGFDRLLAAVKACSGDPRDCLPYLVADVRRFAGRAELTDDITLLGLYSR